MPRNALDRVEALVAQHWPAALFAAAVLVACAALSSRITR